MRELLIIEMPSAGRRTAAVFCCTVRRSLHSFAVARAGPGLSKVWPEHCLCKGVAPFQAGHSRGPEPCLSTASSFDCTAAAAKPFALGVCRAFEGAFASLGLPSHCPPLLGSSILCPGGTNPGTASYHGYQSFTMIDKQIPSRKLDHQQPTISNSNGQTLPKRAKCTW